MNAENSHPKGKPALNPTVVEGNIRYKSPTEINGSLIVKGSLFAEGYLEVNGDLVVEGQLSCHAGLYVTGSIKTEDEIQVFRNLLCDGTVIAGGEMFCFNSIKVGGDLISKSGGIKALEAIEAGNNIRARQNIDAQTRISCANGITAGGWVFCDKFDIQCKYLKNKTLPLGRQFWASLPPLKNWQSKIIDKDFCWNQFEGWHDEAKGSLEAEFIATNNEWAHWSIIGQLRNFLGVTECAVPPNLANNDIEKKMES